ncbi:MAG: molybdopterin molybdenumtransferase MoeA, partial [Candidatus Sumerlaeota bacterium]|nr:molybdopterin molybdenumtransferase MoeA [Candidatus Sumerlaeota bacterium]
MIPLEEAFRLVAHALAGVRLPGETLPVREARGRVLLADQTSRLDQPPFDLSAVDGYAIAAADLREEYRLLETIAAGQTPTQPLVPGTTTKVMTGAPTPAGTARVVMQEDAQERGGVVRLSKRDGPTNLRARGEDLRAGDVVAAAGSLLDAVAIANLIACGVSEVYVAHQAKVAILSTGDEIVDDPRELAPGKVMNSNGPMLAALAK